MNVSDFLPYLGHSEQSGGLSNLLASVGIDVSRIPAKAQRNYGSAGYELKAYGIELTFEFHTNYAEAYGPPKVAGKTILAAIFAYNGASSKRNAYAGPMPFGPIHNRTDALEELGDPSRTEEDDGEIDWDQWIKDDVQIGAYYRPDASIRYVSYSVPMKSTLAKNCW